MVWCLSPVNSFPGARSYYILSAGRYTIGRKGCDVTVQADVGISRVHANLIVDAMLSWDPQEDTSTSLDPCVAIEDVSKYGTYVNKKPGSMKVRDLEGKQTSVRNGDLISLGTAVFSFSYVPLVFLIYGSKKTRAKLPLQEAISAIGVYGTHEWNSACTHVITDDHLLVTKDLINAVLEKKPVIHTNWISDLAGIRICNELPSCSLHCPTLTLEGEKVKIVEPEIREKCLKCHTFILGSSDMYKFGVQLKLLLQACHGKVLTVNELCSNDQGVQDGESDIVVLVVPAGSIKEFSNSHQVSSLSRVDEVKLVAAVLSGHLDSSIIQSSSMHVSSSNSTNETIVADSDVEADTARSDRIGIVSQSAEALKNEAITETGAILERRHKDNEAESSGNQNSDVICSQGLIVRDFVLPIVSQLKPKQEVVNFKCFRKREVSPGNSFKDLIPFSRDPYTESDFDKNAKEYMREEKKRQQMEAMAEDLFNSDKVKRRGAANTSIRSFLTRG